VADLLGVQRGEIVAPHAARGPAKQRDRAVSATPLYLVGHGGDVANDLQTV